MNKNFKQTDLKYVLDYDYDRSSCHCHAYERGDYCRCTSIINFKLTSVGVKEVVKKFYDKYHRTDSVIDAYCFDRICHEFKIYDTTKYEPKYCAGYYGEELEGIYFEDEKQIVDSYIELLNLKTDIEKIQYCLMLEYGYLIESVSNAISCHVETVLTANVVPPQVEYFIKVDKNSIDSYTNRVLPVAVCIKDGTRYKIIDGYHRFVANKSRENLDIIVIERSQN